MRERILVIQLAKLGDFIQSTPLLANLRQKRPETRIVLAAEQPGVLEAARLSPLVDEVFAVAEGGRGPGGPFESVFVLNSHRRAAALAEGLDCKEHYGPRLAGGRLEFTPAQGFLMELMRSDRSLGRFNLVDVWNCLCPEAEPLSLVWPRTEPSPLLGAAEGLKVGFQLGSRNHLRRWPVENFVGLAQGLAEAGLPIRPVLLGSAEERVLGQKFEKLWTREDLRPLNLIGATDLKALAQVLGGLDLLVTADTGTMHLAAALATPVLALFFGPAFGPETGPYGPGHIIYQAAAPCSPCRESADCRLRQCREMPDPQVAARLAQSVLNPGDDITDCALALPAGHRLWRGQRDAFGQVLIPLGRPLMTERETLALWLRELGRKFLRPGYETDSAALAQFLAAYRRPERALTIDGGLPEALIFKAFPGQGRLGTEVRASLVKAFADFGLKLALT